MTNKAMSAEEVAEKIVDKCSKRWIEDVGDGFSCNLDILKTDIVYELTYYVQAKIHEVNEEWVQVTEPQFKRVKEEARNAAIEQIIEVIKIEWSRGSSECQEEKHNAVCHYETALFLEKAIRQLKAGSK